MKTIKEIKFRNASQRTISEITGLPEDTLVEYVGRESRDRESAEYNNSVYRIVESDGDALVVTHLLAENLAFFKKDYFNVKKEEFNKIIHELSEKYQIPFNLGLALGTNEQNYEIFLKTVKKIDYANVKLSIVKGLNGNTSEKKRALLIIFGNETFNFIGISTMGRKNTERISNYILNRCNAWTEKI